MLVCFVQILYTCIAKIKIPLTARQMADKSMTAGWLLPCKGESCNVFKFKKITPLLFKEHCPVCHLSDGTGWSIILLNTLL
jgi:hypothetical protein